MSAALRSSSCAIMAPPSALPIAGVGVLHPARSSSCRLRVYLGPPLIDDAVAMKVIDRILPISGPDAIRCSKDLATQEGIFVGITSGGTFAGALKIAAAAQSLNGYHWPIGQHISPFRLAR
jgi:cysteine synthase